MKKADYLEIKNKENYAEIVLIPNESESISYVAGKEDIKSIIRMLLKSL